MKLDLADRLVPWLALRHPLWITSLVLLVLNDHVLKGAGLLPTAVTGKLSDVAGLIVAPALLATLLGAHRRATMVACHVAPVLALGVLKLVPAAAAAVVTAAAHLGETWAIVADPTDLLASPAALLAWITLVPRMRTAGPTRRDARTLVLAAAGALGCVATSRMPPQAPTLAGGEIVVQSWASRALIRIDVDSGRQLGRLEPAPGGWMDAPVVSEGAVWVADGESVRAIDLATGATRWTHAGPYQAVATVDAHAVYAHVACNGDGCADPRWHAIDRQTKQPRWTVRGARETPPVVAEGLVAIADGPRLVVRDAASGAVRWTRTFAHDARAVAVAAGVLWALDVEGGLLVALDAATSSERRRFTVADAGSLGRTSWGGLSRSATAGPRLLAVVGDEVRAYDPQNPAPVWSRPGTGVARSGEHVLVTGTDALSCVDAETGRLRWQREDLGWMRAAVDGDRIAIRRGDDLVDVHDVATGRLRFRFDLEEGRVTPAP